MGLFGALFTSVSGTQAQSQQTAMISDNIANVSTVGFKRTDASFRSLVTTQTREGRFSPGSVIADRQLRATQQGALRQTNSATDVAVSGNGFFVVRPGSDPNPDVEFQYTRNGEFFEDEQGFLRNTAGFVLYGVPIEESGVTPDFSDLSQLQAVDATTISQNARQTTDAELAINLDSETDSFNNDIDSPNPPTQLPIPNTGSDAVPVNFTRTLRVFDSLGTAQDLVLDFRKTLGPQANATLNILNIERSDVLAGGGGAAGVLPGINNGDTISIEVQDDLTSPPQQFTETIEFQDDPANSIAATSDHRVTTLQDLLNVINNDFGVAAAGGTNPGNYLEIRQNNNDELILQAKNSRTSIEISSSAPGVLAGGGLSLVADQDDFPGGTAGFVERTNASGMAAGDAFDAISGVDPGDAFTVDVDGAGPVTFNAGTTPTVGDIVTQLNGITGISSRLSSDGRIEIQKDDPTVDVVFAETIGTPLSVAAPGDETYGFTQSSGGQTFIFEPEAPLTGSGAGGTFLSSDPYPGQGDFPSFQNTSRPNTQGWWEMTINQPNGVEETRGLINFADDATLNASPNVNDEVAISLTGINFGNGSAPQDIDIDIERFSSFAGANNVIFSDQNGAEVGLRTGVEITGDGVVVARFSNGTTAELFQIPLATFANPNGLNPESGTTFTETETSGEENLNAPGRGGAGFLEAQALEQSNTDLADEFAKLIVTQRAFTANTRTINTVDQMTEELLRLR